MDANEPPCIIPAIPEYAPQKHRMKFSVQQCSFFAHFGDKIGRNRLICGSDQLKTRP
ncbi:Hypothetical protein (plasmid) [Pseudomonas putida]|nr:Hypothetical protein [Pseudomonas putida]